MTTRKIAIKWSLYSLITLIFLFLQNLVFTNIEFGGVHPVIVAATLAVPCMYESLQADLIYGLLYGFVLGFSLSEPFPLFYILSLTICSFLVNMFSRHIIAPGFLCSLFSSTLCSLFLGVFHLFTIPLGEGQFSTAFYIILKETFFSLFLIPVVYFLCKLVHTRITRD